MPEALAVTPVITVTAAKQAASSACHGAKLSPGPAPGAFLCRE